jgi:hypothetical protein
MSGKSEWAEANGLSAQVVKPGTRVGNSTTDNYALVLRDPDDFSFIIQGDPRQLQDLGTQIISMVRECSRGISLGGDAGNGVGL